MIRVGDITGLVGGLALMIYLFLALTHPVALAAGEKMP
jgi:K+-transporting ATPase KdpF subunit